MSNTSSAISEMSLKNVFSNLMTWLRVILHMATSLD